MKISSTGYDDSFNDYLGFLRPRLIEAYRVLKATGSLFFHIDYREVHYCKVMLDEIFGRPSFQNEIIWAYDYGARSKQKWPAKHDNILWYSKDPEEYIFNFDAMRFGFLHGSGPGRAGKGRAWKDSNGCLVAYDSAHQWQREDGVCDAETTGNSGKDSKDALQTRRFMPRLFCG